jgi:CheY-like chemotaxis protein
MRRKNNNPIIIIEDDMDDQQIFKDIFEDLKYPNEVIFFGDGQEALDYLNKTEVIPFIILSDINLPKLDGFALRNKIKMDAELQVKCIPYIFFSTATNQKAVVDAYSLSVQGFFVKEDKFTDFKDTIETIMKYWHKCVAPNHFMTEGADKNRA